MFSNWHCDDEAGDGMGALWCHDTEQDMPGVYESADEAGRYGLALFNDITWTVDCVLLPAFPKCMSEEAKLAWAMELAETYAAEHGLRV